MRNIIIQICIFAFVNTAVCGAVELNKQGGGEVLIFPFFSVEKNWDALLTVSTSAEFEGRYFQRSPGIFRVRVRDAVDGRLVKAFTVYNTRIVNWRISLGKNDNGTTILRVAEGDCLITDTNEILEGEGGQLELGVSAGIVEVYSLGRITQFGTCGEFANNWKPGGRWVNNPTDGVMISKPPLINGEMILVNVMQGLATSYQAIVLGDFTDAHLHRAPDVDFPTLADAKPIVTQSDGSKIILQSGLGIDAVAHTLSLDNQAILANDVILNEEIGARTDWIVSYPLAGYKVFRPFSVEFNGVTKHCESFGKIPIAGQPTVPVNVEVLENSLVSRGAREQIGAYSVELDPPPPVDSRVDFCHAVNVLSFDGHSSILVQNTSAIHSNLSGFTASPTSSLTWKLIAPEFPPDSGIRRPAIAYSLTTFVNGTLNGGVTLANYAILREHRRE